MIGNAEGEREREGPSSSAPLKAITGGAAAEGSSIQCSAGTKCRAARTIAKAHCAAAVAASQKKVAWELGMEKGRGNETSEGAKRSQRGPTTPCFYTGGTAVGRIACLRALVKSAHSATLLFFTARLQMTELTGDQGHDFQD